MDILNLVNKLEELFSQGRSFPFTHNVILNEDQMIDLIDQMRISIPEEIKRSQQILAQRDRILAQAKDEHDRMLEIANEKREQLISSHEMGQTDHFTGTDRSGSDQTGSRQIRAGKPEKARN